MSETLGILKALADDTRLKILRALSERDMYVELLAERLQLSAATVSFHMKKLQAAGLVDSRREQYYIVYSLRKDVFNMTLNELIMPQNGPDAAERLREEMYRRKVIKIRSCRTAIARRCPRRSRSGALYMKKSSRSSRLAARIRRRKSMK